uniref:Uncharacterized protein n=1 Tax=Erythrolobus madagascarensis TaxID=708628 RepID=A0A7S0T7S8_9RHOD|mmetsp:Transcript_4106/g.9016  ORF Transcript_4106/g.9016 Transcript_4106/m.9016 type:complete len:172 (+) Transcript_4106:3-518(+)
MLCGSREGVEVVVRSASRRRQLGLLESALETAILDKKSERELSLEQLDAFTNTMVDVLHEQRTPTRPFARTTEQFANTVSQQLLQQQRNARERLALNTRASASITGSTGMDEKSLEQLKEQLCAVMVDRIIHARPGSHCGAFQTRRAVKYLYDLTTLWTRVVEEYVSFFSD